MGLFLILRTPFGSRWDIVLVGCDTFNTYVRRLEGVVWLVIATAAEVPQVVSPTSFRTVQCLAYCRFAS